VFEHFHAWLYTRKLVHEDDEPLSWGNLFDLWIFGDRFQIPMLQNCVMDEMFAKTYREGYLLPLCLLKAIYLKTVEESLLRKAVIELLTHAGDLGDVEGSMTKAENRQSLTLEILQDVVRELHAARKNKIPFGKAPKRDKCFFHVHGKDEHC
jgi:hypothetical protein